jgi:hypothetical protein
LYPSPPGLFFDHQGIGFLVQTDGFFMVFHEVFGWVAELSLGFQ